MSVVDKVRALALPNDQYVVIGSGLLDAWNLREASDVDMVVTDALFDELSQDARFVAGTKHGDRFLEWGDYEVCDNWGSEGSFDQLYADSLLVDGVRFVSPDYLIAWKERRNEEKDRRDVALLKERLHDGER